MPPIRGSSLSRLLGKNSRRTVRVSHYVCLELSKSDASDEFVLSYMEIQIREKAPPNIVRSLKAFMRNYPATTSHESHLLDQADDMFTLSEPSPIPLRRRVDWLLFHVRGVNRVSEQLLWRLKTSFVAVGDIAAFDKKVDHFFVALVYVAELIMFLGPLWSLQQAYRSRLFAGSIARDYLGMYSALDHIPGVFNFSSTVRSIGSSSGV